MLALPTEATTEAMNICTNRRQPFRAYNDHNRGREFGFIQQNIVVNRRRGEGHENHEWQRVIETLTPRLQPVFLSDFDILMQANTLILQHKQTYLFLSYFSSLAIIQTNSSLARMKSPDAVPMISDFFRCVKDTTLMGFLDVCRT